FDAAVAAAVAIAVIDPRMSSIGGHEFATIYIAKTKQVRALNFYGDAPKGATVAAYTGKDYHDGYLSPPVPIRAERLRGAACRARKTSLAAGSQTCDPARGTGIRREQLSERQPRKGT